jgi:hypothetical protein
MDSRFRGNDDINSRRTQHRHSRESGNPSPRSEGQVFENLMLLPIITYSRIEVFSEPGVLKAQHKPMLCGPTG